MTLREIILPGDTGHITDHETIAKRLNTDEHISPYNFGAIGDGQLHPLSEQYSTLGAAQLDYPCAASLSDQIDWAAHQTAINSISLYYAGYMDFGQASVQGGIIQFRHGDFQLNKPLLFTNNTWLIGPSSAYTNHGSGFNACVFRPTEDFDGTPGNVNRSGKYLFKFMSNWMHFNVLKGFGLSGKTIGGTRISQLSGFGDGTNGMGENSIIDEIVAEDFDYDGLYVMAGSARGHIGSLNLNRNHRSGLHLHNGDAVMRIDFLSGDMNGPQNSRLGLDPGGLLWVEGGSTNCVLEIGGVKAEGGIDQNDYSLYGLNMDPVIDLDSYQGEITIRNMRCSNYNYNAGAPPSTYRSEANAMIKINNRLAVGNPPTLTVDNVAQALSGLAVGHKSYTNVVDATAFNLGKVAFALGGHIPGQMQINKQIVLHPGHGYDANYGVYGSGGLRIGANSVDGWGRIEWGKADQDIPDVVMGILYNIPGTFSIGPGDPTVAGNFAIGLEGGNDGSGVHGNIISTWHSWLQLTTAAGKDIFFGDLTDAGIVKINRNLSFGTGKTIANEAVRAVGAGGQPAYTNSWVTYTGFAGYYGAGFYKDAMGRVHLRGIISSGTLASSAFLLPVGYRPLSNHVFMVLSNNSVGRLQINSDGTVVPQSPSSNVWVTLSGVSFLAEQ